jgi:hypothetical protein
MALVLQTYILQRFPIRNIHIPHHLGKTAKYKSDQMSANFEITIWQHSTLSKLMVLGLGAKICW